MRDCLFRKGLVVGIILLFFGASVVPSISESIKSKEIKKNNINPLDELEAYWKFDEGSGDIAYDSSGNGNDGTIYGATWTANTPCDSGYALDFDGINDYVNVNSVINDLNDDQTGTLAAWIYKASQAEPLDEPTIFDAAHGTNDDTKIQFAIWEEGDNDYLTIKVRDDQRNIAFFKRTISFITLNKWHHVAAVQEGISIKLYVDGINQPLIDRLPGDSEGDWFADLGTDKPNLATLGACFDIWHGYVYEQFFPGVIDEVRIYSKALTEDEIQHLYNNSGNQNPNAPTITGETNGKTGEEYVYTFNAEDPNGDYVKYYIDWDDGSSQSTALSPSGTDVKVKHTWCKQGTYTIKAHAKDTDNLWGPWGELTVTMRRNRAINTPFKWFLQQHPNLFPLLQKLLLLQR